MKTVFTDGSCSPNPGPGGYAVVSHDGPVALGYEKNSTNIRMEGRALIAAMRYAGSEEIEIYTDSEFWINVLTKWAPGWKTKNWRKSGGEIKNLDLVQEAYGLYERGSITLTWVRGHNNHDGNELADLWANKARQEKLSMGA